MKTKTALVAALCAFALHATPAAAQTDPGVTADSVKIGVFAPLSGNAMSYGFDVVNAVKMWYDKINREGGIHGRRIDYVIEDDRCNANDLVAAVKKLTEQERVFALNGGSCSAAVVAARGYVERSEVPLVILNASADAALYPPSKYIYGAFSATQRVTGGSAVAFADEHLKAKTIGYINHDDAYGGWNLEAAQYQLKATNSDAKLVVQSINPNITDVTAVMLKMRAANPDVLLLLTYARPAALIIRKAHEMGFDKPIVLAITGTADVTQLAENVGKDALRNFYFQDVVADIPGGPKLQWVYDMYKEAYPDLAAKPGHPQAYMPYGVASAMAVTKALEAAGPDLTRERFLEAMSTLKFESNVMAGPLEFSPDDHAAQKAAIFVKYDGQTRELVPGSFKSLWVYQP